MSDARDLHIAPGPSAAGCLNQALRPAPGALLANHDLLSSGPLAPLVSLDDWRQFREAHLATISYPDVPPFGGARDLLTHAGRLRDARSITLWIGTGLAEQLLLVWTCQLLRLLGVEPSRLQLIQFIEHPAAEGMEVVSLGILSPEHLRAHPPAVRLEAEMLAELDMAWAAVTAPEPELLLRYLRRPRTSLRFLKLSLETLLERFPDRATGLNVWDTALLKYTAERGPDAVRVIGYTLGESMDRRDWVGEGYLLSRLRRLGNPALPQPLVVLAETEPYLRGAEVRLTDAGQAVLAGTLDALEVNGVDDWIGGMHVNSAAGHIWVHGNGTLIRVGRAGAT